MALARIFLRCAVCGARRPRPVFVVGALAEHVLEALEQRFVGCGRGLAADGEIPRDESGRPLRGRARGAFQWVRRPLTQCELETIGRSVAMAGERIARRLDGAGPEIDHAEALRTFSDDELRRYVEGMERKRKSWEAMIQAELARRECS